MSTDDHNANHIAFHPELLQKLEYDIEVLESDNVASQQARMLVIRPEYKQSNILFIKHKDTSLTIPISDVNEILPVSNISGKFGKERNSVINITFYSSGVTAQRSIILDVKTRKFVNTIEQQVNLLKDAEENPSLRKAIITKLYPEICNKCLENKRIFEFKSNGKVCLGCFEKQYGKMLLQIQIHQKEELAQYNGGHKDHILTKVFGSQQTSPGKMYLTENYFIFAKEEKDIAKRWEMVIQLQSVISNWSAEEKARQGYVEWEGTSLNNFAFGSGFIRMQGKQAKIVIPFVETNGNFQEPEFILTSPIFARIWAADLYKQLAKTNTKMSEGGLISDSGSDSSNSNTVIQTTANCFNCGREFEIYNLAICKHCLSSFCDICIGNHSIESKLYFDAKYLGGHKLYPKSVDARVNIFSDRIEIPELHLRVPYAFISNIENADEKKITAKRIFLAGLFAFGWRKKDVYTIIEYLDGFNQKQDLVFDFGKNVQEAQQRIYDRMLASHFARDRLLEQAALNDTTAKVQRLSMQQTGVTENNIDNIKPSQMPKLPDADRIRDNPDPLYILKVRFAKGEISKEEYEEMRRLLES